MIDPTSRLGPAPAREPNRAIHAIDSSGFATVAVRPPKRGELFADCRGPAAWIFLATADNIEPKLIVKPSKELSYP